MPNNEIPRPISSAMQNAFGGSPAAPAPQPSAPVAPPAGGSATGSVWDALINYLKPNQAFGQNAAEALTKDKYVR